MASSPSPGAATLAVDAAPPVVVRIEPSGGWAKLRLEEVWEYRELLYFLVWRDVKIRYKQTAIGIIWVVLQPVLTMIVFTLFFGRLAKMPSDGLPYSVFYFAAVVPWMYFSTALQNATNVMIENQGLITKVYFPRLILPFSVVLSGLVDFAIGFVVLVIFTLAYGFRPGVAALLLPVLVFLAALTALGVGLWTTALNALYRDVKYVMPFLAQFWLLASPVAYPSSRVPGKWRWVYELNPMAGVIDGFRWVLTGHGEPPGLPMAVSICAVVVILFGGLFFFNRLEGTIADRV